MQQYFIEQNIEKQTQIQMNPEQAHHISHVMRMREGEEIRLADLDAHLCLATVHYEGGSVFAYIKDIIEDHTKNAVKLTLLQGMIKKDKWDFLLQKSAELGVDHIVPFLSSRSVVKTKEERMDKKMLRWNKILQEACEQCKRSTLVKLEEPCSLTQASQYKSELNLIAYEDADVKGEKLSNILRQYPKANSVTLVIGCEGGFSREEVSELCKQGYIRISLGTRILRAETAAMAGINSIAFYYEMAGDEHEDNI